MTAGPPTELLANRPSASSGRAVNTALRMIRQRPARTTSATVAINTRTDSARTSILGASTPDVCRAVKSVAKPLSVRGVRSVKPRAAALSARRFGMVARAALRR